MSRWLGNLVPLVLVVVGAALFGFAGGWYWQASGAGRGATEEIVKGYLLDHPEILPQAIERLQARQLESRIAPLRSSLEAPYPGAILGNPQGKLTLVEFSDYACPYCRLSLHDVDAMLQANPDVKLVMREFPILTPASIDAAKMALAAAEQGHYAAFHRAMFELGPPNAGTIDAAARKAGLDLAKAKAAIAAGKYDMELAANAQLGEALGINGTPAWIIGSQAFSGAVGTDRLSEAVKTARGS